jgi:hypothetical protein
MVQHRSQREQAGQAQRGGKRYPISSHAPPPCEIIRNTTLDCPL